MMKKTTDIARDRAYDETKTVFPAEMARGTYITNPPSLRALKLMHLMINRAGGRMADDTRHDMRLSDVRAIDGMANHDRKSLQPLFQELAGTVLTYDDTESKKVSIGGLMEHTTIDYKDEENGDLALSWRFGRTFRIMAEESNHWAILDRQTVFHFQSKYSVLLFQYFASLQGLKYKTGEVFTVQQLRELLGIPKGKITRFADLNRRALQPAISEINQLARFTLTATSKKIGRTVSTIEIQWEPKTDIGKVKRELGNSSVGRKTRRDGSVDIIPVSFPATGSVRYTKPWEDLARENELWDYDKIADAFRSFCSDRNIKLDAQNIEEIFKNYCKKLKPEKEPRVSSDKRTEEEKIAAAIKNIKSGKPYMCTGLSQSLCEYLVAEKLVSVEECRKVGL